jgi:curved DNA-binding protein CbpA
MLAYFLLELRIFYIIEASRNSLYMANSLPPNPYEVLGIAKDAGFPEIRSAHRKMVLKCHPDKVQDATLKAVKQDEFQKVQQAYELLSDDSRRLQYDEQVKLWELRKESTKTPVEQFYARNLLII